MSRLCSKNKGIKLPSRRSKHDSFKAQIVVSANSDRHRNITQVQISYGSARHGNVSYVKINTNNAGKFKVIDALKSDYKSDRKETATFFFSRERKKMSETIKPFAGVDKLLLLSSEKSVIGSNNISYIKKYGIILNVQ